MSEPPTTVTGVRPRPVKPRSPAVDILGVDPAGTVASWGAGAERLFGWTASEVIGRRLPIVPKDVWHEFARLLDARGRNDDQDGHATGLLVPVTEPETGDVAPIPSSLANARMEAVGRLAGGVAHDFNNILTAIAGYAGLLAQELPAGDPKQRDVAEIRKATERATKLTRQLLSFGRLEPQEVRMLDVNDGVTDVLPMLRQLIGAHIDLITNAAVDLPPVSADPGRPEQVLVNLVLNARDAMPRGGRLVVSTGVVDLDKTWAMAHPGSTTGPAVQRAVEDSGLGMTEMCSTTSSSPTLRPRPPSTGPAWACRPSTAS